MISSTAEYALRAVVHLAETPDARRTSDQIAAATKVAPAYLSKVLESLGRAGLVDARRGPGGGYALTADPTTLTALAVIDAVDPLARIDGCPLELPQHAAALCPLHAQLDEAIAAARAALAAHTVADLVASRGTETVVHFPETDVA